MNKKTKILVLGGRGLAGSSFLRAFKSENYENILAPTRMELNLLDQNAVGSYFLKHQPMVVIDAAAKVGGIQANNTMRADFIFQNLTIQNNVFKACFESDVEKLLFLGSSCIYPRNCPQPIKEEYLLTGPLEPTNEPYAVAKIAGLKMAESFKRQHGKNFFSVMPANLYGINDNFHTENSHVIPCLIQRMSKTLQEGNDTFEVWGSGRPKREFLYVDDLISACLFLLNYHGDLPFWLNIGTGNDVTIKKLAETIADVMRFKGKIIFNTKYPDGAMKKCLDISKIESLGWSHRINLRSGIEKTVQFFYENKNLRRY